MNKLPKVIAALVAVGFAVALGAAPAGTAGAAPHMHSALDTGWD